MASSSAGRRWKVGLVKATGTMTTMVVALSGPATAPSMICPCGPTSGMETPTAARAPVARRWTWLGAPGTNLRHERKTNLPCTERDFGDDTRAGEHADPGDLDHVRAHGRRGLRLPRDHHGRLGPVLSCTKLKLRIISRILSSPLSSAAWASARLYNHGVKLRVLVCYMSFCCIPDLNRFKNNYS
jgi:hypothetical protein